MRKKKDKSLGYLLLNAVSSVDLLPRLCSENPVSWLSVSWKSSKRLWEMLSVGEDLDQSWYFSTDTAAGTGPKSLAIIELFMQLPSH